MVPGADRLPYTLIRAGDPAEPTVSTPHLRRSSSSRAGGWSPVEIFTRATDLTRVTSSPLCTILPRPGWVHSLITMPIWSQPWSAEPPGSPDRAVTDDSSGKAPPVDASDRL